MSTDYYNSIPADQINRHWNEIITEELVKRARERWGDGDSTVVALQKNIGNFVVALSRFHSDRVGFLFDGWTEWVDGARRHYVNAQSHCQTGPATVYPDGRASWWLNDKPLTESEWQAAVAKPSPDAVEALTVEEEERVVARLGEVLRCINLTLSPNCDPPKGAPVTPFLDRDLALAALHQQADRLRKKLGMRRP